MFFEGLIRRPRLMSKRSDYKDQSNNWRYQQMRSATRDFINELDTLIKNETSVDAFDLPYDYIDNLNVSVICSTYNSDCPTEFDGLHFILQLVDVNEAKTVFCRLTCGDGGVLIARTDLTKNMNELLFKSAEGWIYF